MEKRQAPVAKQEARRIRWGQVKNNKVFSVNQGSNPGQFGSVLHFLIPQVKTWLIAGCLSPLFSFFDVLEISRKGDSFMPQTENTRELIRQSILRLKQKKQEQSLTNQQIFDMVLARGLSISESSIKRVFADGSEDICNFNYNLTIKPLNIALLDIPDSALAIPEEATPEEKDLVALRNTVRLREILDDELAESNRRLREENARLLQQLQVQEQKHAKRVEEVRRQNQDKVFNLQEQLKGERNRRRGITAVAIILGVLLFVCAVLLIAYLMEDHGNPAGGIFWREAASFFFGGSSAANQMHDLLMM